MRNTIGSDGPGEPALDPADGGGGAAGLAFEPAQAPVAVPPAEQEEGDGGDEQPHEADEGVGHGADAGGHGQQEVAVAGRQGQQGEPGGP